ncbi:MAG: M56 family metallopeptidase [Chloroflexota bacterium]
MIGSLLELALGNAAISLTLAVLAYAVHRHRRYPAVAHLLWVLVLVKAITPPLLVLPVAVGQAVVSTSPPPAGAAIPAAMPSIVADSMAAFALEHAPIVLALAWLLGSSVVLVTTVRRIRRFGRLLGTSARPAPPPVDRLARSVAYELGLRSLPPVFVTAAAIAPMSWWSRGRVRLILPVSLLQQVDSSELRWVLAHELAHVKRHDHLVRWLEWAATVGFWWNPIVWWARRCLRLDEEDACDALVLEHVEGSSRAYAGTLLTVVEVLSRSGRSAPAMATGIDAARSLERRLSNIVSARPGSRSARAIAAGATALAVGIMAVGIGSPSGAAATQQGGTAVEAPVASTAGPSTVTIDLTSTRHTTVSAILPASSTPSNGRYTGTSADDVVTGTPEGSRIAGRGGDDDLRGGGGRDVIRGGFGNDVIRGGSGPDQLFGGAGDDVMRGGSGRDTVDAGAGADVVYVWTDGTPDQVDCGAGIDRAVIDSTDVARYCETVIVRDPA